MIASWAVILSALVYLCLLFAVAHWGDLSGRRIMQGRARATIYALALAVYCTSWTFFGSVGLASRSGLDFLTIYIGPILVIGLGYRLVTRVVRLAKAQNITSVADFVAARYGKSERVAALVSAIALVGSVPYIALQLKAVSASLGVFLAATDGPFASHAPVFGDLAFVVALVLAGFAVAFGTRHADATEHQDGLMMAISLESVVKLVELPRRRDLRHLLHVRRPRRDRAGPRGPQPRPLDRVPRLGSVELRDPHSAVRLGIAAAAAAVPYGRGGEPGDRGRQARSLALPALPRPDQPFRHPDRARRPCGL